VILPADGAYAASLADAFAVVGLAASTCPAPPAAATSAPRRYCISWNAAGGPHLLWRWLRSTVRLLCWPPEVGAALAAAVMGGDYAPRLIEGLSDKGSRSSI
jgi:hypothetical protein